MPDAVSVYDAAGMRVAERVNDVWRFSIYDIGGKIVAEYGGVGATDEGGVKYLLSDWQGSTRAMMSNGGVVKARMDYTAYGEEIQAGVGLRTATQGFDNSTALRQKYGLTERDSATGLDHTPWRKNENRAGRWTSPDPFTGSASIGDPQSFNRFSYVQGDPTNYIDPSGLEMRYVDERAGMTCIWHDDDQKWHCVIHINRYWFDTGNGTGSSEPFFFDGRYGLDDLTTAAENVINNAVGKCKDLLGEHAIAEFSRIKKNIQYDDQNLNVPRSSEARTIGENIYLNPWSMTFSEDYRAPREEDKRLNKPTLLGRQQFNKTLREYNEILKDYGVSSFDYAVAGIIHEFLHAIGEFGPDSGGQSMQNQKEVLKKCFKKGK